MDRSRELTSTAAQDLWAHIQAHTLVDTHEHLARENEWLTSTTTILECLFPPHYAGADLRVAGAPEEAVARVYNDPDIEASFAGIRDAWEAMRHTGFGEAVLLSARSCFGMDNLSPQSLADAQLQLQELRRPGRRRWLLHELAGLDHVQIDAFIWAIEPEEMDTDFFHYDLSWADFASGNIDTDLIHQKTGITVSDVDSLREAFHVIFETYGKIAIAVKSQHAYERTLHWSERSDTDAATALEAVIRGRATPDDRLCVGDWCLARGVELATAMNLPIKLHTGYYARVAYLPVERISAGQLWPLLSRYPHARFVLMHTAYPYDREVIAVAKNYPNVWLDLCWAWSIDPLSASDFTRRFLHAVPYNKLFAFGGDTVWPIASVGYAQQARTWLYNALACEIADGYLTRADGLKVATALMQENQYACFDISGRRQELRRVSPQDATSASLSEP